MSGGIRQRVMIGMGLACEPALLIADEPTTALDVTVQAQVLNLIKILCRERRTAVLLITHDMGVIANMCQRVVVMYAGRVVEQANVLRLFQSPAHPYTNGLLRSLPKVDQKQKRLYSIDGQPPKLNRLPAGCSFSPRCPGSVDRCRMEAPVLTAIARDHHVRCHFPVLGAADA
jgi:oligopeptide/dipeptide ABC transporter ATP-binding protein